MASEIFPFLQKYFDDCVIELDNHNETGKDMD